MSHSTTSLRAPSSLVYTLARWDRREPPRYGGTARPQDLKYFLRVASCDNGITIPLPVRAPESRTLAHLRAIIAFMESYECSQMNLPLKIWRLARDFAFTFHAFWTDARTEVTATRAEICALIIHTTPYKRLTPIPDATDELLDIMSYAKTSMPWDVYLPAYVTSRMAWWAADDITADSSFNSQGVNAHLNAEGLLEEVTGGDTLETSDLPEGLDDRPGSRLHQARDGRERFDINIDKSTLPRLPPGILAHISLPRY